MDDRVRLSRRIRFLLLAWLRRSRSGRIEFVRRFGYKEMTKATEGFRKVIYSNYHGTAYRAKLKGGEVALVKELKAFDLGRDKFLEEVQLLGRLRHRHLLTLRGFCTGRKRLLVFGNIENGSLKEHLNDPLKTPLNWKSRIKIAIGVAAALVSCFYKSWMVI
uniref:Putative receptor-like protein kinase n=1 Tax=Noccaea caerulescens TaxID=107243 RepID=A0A1J3HX75_NOCCA